MKAPAKQSINESKTANKAARKKEGKQPAYTKAGGGEMCTAAAAELEPGSPLERRSTGTVWQAQNNSNCRKSPQTI